jgi:hypothetical protein
MPFALLVSDYMNRLEKGDPATVESRKRLHKTTQRIFRRKKEFSPNSFVPEFLFLAVSLLVVGIAFWLMGVLISAVGALWQIVFG